MPRSAPPAVRDPSTRAESAPPPALPGPVRVAVVGAGYIAEYHLAILRDTPGVEVVAVVDRDLERARRAAARHGVPHAVRSAAEAAELGVRVAHVLVPPDLHVRVARELLELGIGVFVEKPLALSAADGSALVELARARGLVLGVNHNAVHHPAFARLRADVRAGRIGRVEHVQVTLSVPLRQLDAGDHSHWMFREPRNIVFEQGPHPFSQLVELIGAPRDVETRILGTRELEPGQLFHDRWLVSGRGDSATAEVWLAFGQDFTKSEVRVLGSDGALEADLHHDLFAREAKTQWLDFWNSFLAGWRRGGMLRRSAAGAAGRWFRQTLGRGPRGDAFWVGMRDSIRAFHAAVAAGVEPPSAGERATAVLAWCDAAVRGLAAARPAEPLPATPSHARPGEVCVLGANGFIGRRTVAALHARGRPVTAITRRRHSLPREIVSGVRSGAVRLAQAGLDDEQALLDATRGARVVVHLATGGGADWDAVQRGMVEGTLRVARACLANGVERLIYVSSAAALYLGHDCGREVVDDDVGPDPRPEERALYARGKVAAENALRALARESRLPVTIVRPAVVVGPGAPLQHSGLGLWVRDNHCVGWGRGERPVPLVLVDDVADALARLSEHEGHDLDGRALNLAARTPLSAAQVVRAYAERTGRAFTFHPRSLALSQTLEIGKWLVKRAGGQSDAPFPSYRDLKSRELWPVFSCRTARDVLGWRPCEDPDELLERSLRTTGGAP